MRAVYLYHRELDNDGLVGVLHNKIARMVVDPVARAVKVALGRGFLAIRCQEMEPHGLDVPTMDSIKTTDPATESFQSPA